ncbi:MAG: hypothetical protein ABI438_07605 [Dermatophilaceae bacterium]
MAGLVVLILVICVLLLAEMARLLLVRRRLVRRTDVFRCKVRVTRGSVPHFSHRWPLRAGRAEWKHDVLLLHHGLGLGTAHPVAVRFAEDAIEPVQPVSPLRMGSGAVMLRLRLDDDAVIAVASSPRAWEMLAGPFIAIAAQGLSPTSPSGGPDRPWG